MSEIEMTLNTIGKEIQHKIDINGTREGIFNKTEPKFQHISGRKLNLYELTREGGLHDSPVEGALKLTYCAGRFLLVDRIVKNKKNKFKKQRRILFFLKDKSGQISSSVLLELLKVEHKQKFSKHDLIQKIDEQYFINNGISISSGDINEVFSRMIRHTFSDFFAIEGRSFVKKNYLLKIEEISLKENEKYEMYRSRINEKTFSLVKQLNESPYIANA